LISRLAALEGLSYDAIDALIEEHATETSADDSRNPIVGDIRVALDKAFAKNNVEDIVASLEQLSAQSDKPDVQAWATTTLESLRMRSPTSLKVALQAIRRGKSFSLIECLNMELGIATAFCVSPRSSRTTLFGVFSFIQLIKLSIARTERCQP
jgi:3-hydroxyisobutyryl-CoA hydrolase